MTVWLYTEIGVARRDGPFFSLEDTMDSPLWEWPGVCAWLEELGLGGWYYENVRWTGEEWRVTSQGVRPADLFRPASLLDSKQIPHIERPRVSIGERRPADSCAGICDERNAA